MHTIPLYTQEDIRLSSTRMRKIEYSWLDLLYINLNTSKLIQNIKLCTAEAVLIEFISNITANNGDFTGATVSALGYIPACIVREEFGDKVDEYLPIDKSRIHNAINLSLQGLAAGSAGAIQHLITKEPFMNSVTNNILYRVAEKTIPQTLYLLASIPIEVAYEFLKRSEGNVLEGLKLGVAIAAASALYEHNNITGVIESSQSTDEESSP